MQTFAATAPWPVTIGLLAALLALLVLGLAAAIFPVRAAKIHSRYLYKVSVVTRAGKEIVLPEYVVMLGARDSDEALAKLRMMIDDPAKVVPVRVFMTRAVGFLTAVLCLAAIPTVLFADFIG